MRPVNLIPIEQRQGGRAPMRSGPVAYIVVGALIAALAGVTLLVVTDNQISDRKVEVTQFRREDAMAKARAARLAAYTQFRAVHDQRIATVTSLADSRFDWERVMRELALILPRDVWLTNLTGTVNPQVAPEGGANVSLRADAPGPALSLVGCAGSQDAVAGFVQGLKDIEGVTRVGVQSSALNNGSASASANGGSATASGGTSSPCQRKSVAQFQIVAAFDAAPVPSTASSSAESTSSATPSTGTTTSSAGSSTSTSSTTPSSTTSTTSAGSGEEGGEG